MKCRIKFLVYTVFSLGFASSLLLMVYNVTHLGMPRLLRNASISLNETPPDDFVQLMNFNDLGSGKERLHLLVVTNSAPHKSERRMAIRSTWWRHCTESQVNIIKVILVWDTCGISHYCHRFVSVNSNEVSHTCTLWVPIFRECWERWYRRFLILQSKRFGLLWLAEALEIT